MPSAHASPTGTGLPVMDRAVFTAPPRMAPLRRFAARFGAALISMQDAQGPRFEVRMPAAAQHVLALRRTGTATSRVFAEGREAPVALRPDTLTLIPAGIETVWDAPSVAQTTLHMHIAPAWLDALADQAGLPPASGRLPLGLGFTDQNLSQRMAALLRAEALGLAGQAPELELAGMACAVELLRLSLAPGQAVRHHLSPAALRRVLEMIEAELGGGLTLTAMAAEARLSPFHFARAFKAETGMPPAAYVMRRRCEAGRRLILEGKLSLADVALACGFSHQSHFTTMFKRMTGMTPGQLRASQLVPPRRSHRPDRGDRSRGTAVS